MCLYTDHVLHQITYLIFYAISMRHHHSFLVSFRLHFLLIRLSIIICRIVFDHMSLIHRIPQKWTFHRKQLGSFDVISYQFVYFERWILFGAEPLLLSLPSKLSPSEIWGACSNGSLSGYKGQIMTLNEPRNNLRLVPATEPHTLPTVW